MNTTVANAIRQATVLVDSSGAASMVEDWLTTAPKCEPRTLLVGWLAAALSGTRLTDHHVAKILVRALGADAPSQKAVKAGTRQLMKAIDYDRATYTDDVASAATRAEKRQRHLDLSNAVLRAQLDQVSSAETISVSVSSLFRTATMSSSDETGMFCAGLAVRETPARWLRFASPTVTVGYGWEYEVATLVSSDRSPFESVPRVVVAVAGHTPRFKGHSVDELVRGILGLGRDIDCIVGGSEQFPTEYSSALNRTGATSVHIVSEFTAEDEGEVLQSAGEAQHIEGRWYRPGMPDTLRHASRDFRAASLRNLTEDECVLSPDVEAELRYEYEALVAARRNYEVPAPSSATAPVHRYPYGSGAWMLAFSGGRLANREVTEKFDRFAGLCAEESEEFNAARHGFLTMLAIVATNADSIADWKYHNELDEGSGLLWDVWGALYDDVSTRIQDAMAAWSLKVQPDAVAQAARDKGWGGYWHVDLDEDGWTWVPDDSASEVEVEVAAADERTAGAIADPLIRSLQAQAEVLLAAQGSTSDLSDFFRVELRFEFLDEFKADEDDRYLPLPTEGALLSAEAVLVPGRRMVRDLRL